MTHIELAEVIAAFKLALRNNPDRESFDLTMTRQMLEAVLEYLYTLDPDMPPRPICKALGPLVGDIMMNTKLNRIDELTDVLGPIVIRLGMIADQMERHA